jgi:hypothetical protein
MVIFILWHAMKTLGGSTLSWTSGLNRGVWPKTHSCRFAPETEAVTIAEGAGPQGHSGLVRQISPLQGIDRRTLSLHLQLYPGSPSLTDITQERHSACNITKRVGVTVVTVLLLFHYKLSEAIQFLLLWSNCQQQGGWKKSGSLFCRSSQWAQINLNCVTAYFQYIAWKTILKYTKYELCADGDISINCVLTVIYL